MEFLLDPDVVYLNHGSFGACPRAVHDEYQRLQRRLELEPVRFLQRELPALHAGARAALAEFVGADATDVVFVPNPTYAVNEIVRSLRLGPGDEVLTTNHEYGACRNAWQFMSERLGFGVVEVALPITVDDESFVEHCLLAMTDRTRVVFVSHITSPTACTFPVAALCARARQRGILTVVDGAHAPGQLPLDLRDVGADFYVGACHKWMCAPKGASFLFADPAAQLLLEPLVVGWGWGDRRQFDSGSSFLDHHEWLGTHDPAAVLTVPTAIAFQRDHDWPTVRERCHELAVDAVERADRIPGVARVHADDRFVQMGLVELDLGAVSPRAVQRRLFDEHLVEVPVIEWTDADGARRVVIRVSLQAYNGPADVDAFVDAVTAVAADWCR